LSKGQIVEQKGELVVLDEDGRFYANANSLGVMEHKPSKEAVDRLVAETRKREADKEAKRRKKRAGEDGDVSYINKRNKVFNEKLSRYALDDEHSTDFAIGFMISIREKHGRRSSEGVVCNRRRSVTLSQCQARNQKSYGHNSAAGIRLALLSCFSTSSDAPS